MKKDKNLDPEFQKLQDEEYQRVEEEEIDKEVAKAGRNLIISLAAAAIGALILFNTDWEYLLNNPSEVETRQEDNTQVAIQPTIEEDITSTIDNTNTTAEFKFSDEELDYSNVDTFFNKIVEYRNQYGEFAESFQSKSDVINFVNFLNMFDETKNVESTINSQEMFDEIISDYYRSCVKYGVEPNLSSLIPEGTYMYQIMSEGERLAYNTKNFNNSKDYESANKYYIYILKNFLDSRTAVPQYNKYDPYIEWAREQYEEYRNLYNNINARRFQKNHTLEGCEGVTLYYAYQGEEGAEYEIAANSWGCPDIVDNLFSKSENIEETKWISSYDGTVPFEQVNQGFKDILKKRAR